MKLVYSFYSFLLVLSLFFSVTNLIPLSVSFFAALILITPLIFFINKSSISKISFFVLLFLIYSFVNLLIYDYSSIFNYQFYRYDGNFFVSLFPFIFLILFKSKLNINYIKILKLFLFIAVSVSLFFVCFQIYKNTYITGPFISTNAFGGFLISCLSISFFLDIKKINKYLLIIFFTIMLLLSNSRGSILGILLGLVAFYLIINKRAFFITFLLIFSILITQFSILLYTYPQYKEFKSEILSEKLNYNDSEKLNNIYIRIYENWPRGLYLFLNSPVFGTGVGSANDHPLILDDNKIIQFNNSKNRIYNSAHVHNYYLHVLAEQGIIGLLLFILFLWSIFSFLIKSKKATELRNILLLIYFSLIFASFTENRFVSPSNIFPFILLFIIFYGMKGEIKNDHVRFHNIKK